jgi:uncharacterized repeat protein (TIGR03803 family)
MKSTHFGPNFTWRLVAIVALAAAALPGSKLNASNAESVIYNFATAAEGIQPHGTLIADKSGNLYGTTTYGGSFGNGATLGNGVVFELTSTGTDWTETVLYEFQGGSNDGANPFSALTMDTAGNLYGTTDFGGYQNCTGGCGTVFELSPPGIAGGAWTESVLHSFSGGSDGQGPRCTLALDNAGNLYGTTGGGGAAFGVVFELSPPIGGGEWTETILHVFQGGSDGEYPESVVFGKGGALYGAARSGGEANAGMIYEMVPQAGKWVYHALYSFTGGADGLYPEGGLIADKAGDLYGTTNAGGANVLGNVFKVTLPTSGSPLTETVLYSFPGGTSGSFPTAALVFDKAGNLYGTTSGGDEGPVYPGTVFQLIPPSGGTGAWNQTILLLFNEPKGGTNPFAGLVFGKGGSLYGTTPTGGAIGAGVVFRVAP